MKLKYTITLLSEWHAGSGLSGGASADSITLKDERGLPYLPGKTIKGLLRDSLEEIKNLQRSKCSDEDFIHLFGNSEEKPDDNDFGTKSHFTNAVLTQIEQDEIVSNKLQAHLYSNITSTTIDQDGLAKNKTLRSMELCVPVTLEAYISGVSDKEIELLTMAMQWTRNLGMKRNRGFGKCKFEIKN